MTLMDSLINLHQVDAQVRGLRSRLDSAQRYLTAQQNQLDALEQERGELQARLKHTQAAIANAETETAQIDERIEKLRNELNSAATNKQYAALLAELNSIKEGRGEIEDRMLQEMESVDQIQAQLEGVQQQVDERSKVRDVAQQQLTEREAEIGDRLAELEVERTQAAASMPGQHLAVFEEVANIYDGESMAEIIEVDRRHRDYACGACQMIVPFEHVSALLSGGDQLMRCTACSRILYIQEEMRGALAKK